MRFKKTEKNTSNKTASAASGRSVIGIDIGQHSIRMVQLSGRNLAQPQLEKYATVALPKNVVSGSEITDFDQLVSHLQQCYSKLKTNCKHANIALPASAVTVEEGFIYANDSDISLQESVEAEVSRLGALDEMNYDWSVLSDNGHEQNVLIVAAKTEAVDKCNDLLDEVSLSAVCVDVDLLAMANAFLLAQASESDGTAAGRTAFFDVGDISTKALIVENGIILYKHEANFGLEQLIQQIQLNYQVSDHDALEMISNETKRPADYKIAVADSFNMQIAQEVQRTMQFFYATQNIDSTSNIKQILISGIGCVPNTGVAEAIYAQTSIATRQVNPITLAANKTKIDDAQLAKDAPALTTAFGLALRGLVSK